MRTGSAYRASLRDGRKVWVMNDGLVADVTSHAATGAMVEEYVAWYDRHFDPAWRETLQTETGSPVWAILPRSVADLRGDEHLPVPARACVDLVVYVGGKVDAISITAMTDLRIDLAWRSFSPQLLGPRL